ncbi:hypothetical protein DMB66_19025 [Actinoplanes sp. ATCC 53533]|uniref:hypothetical protein n=1 Tax=Actinoplanes sp. ATCC 53533 TaxID=1288362 RepID=UPI000F78EF53|nr:hypothetical protein [Actinoplanes sp. ATCC 53533]RSM64738.1 hypothetical protein DMB66_19025 [Actinoplanes sp. ATCC 53533]
MTAVLRPTFSEGQILAAADLEAGVGHPRNHAARHDRYLHQWGIAEGLTLAKEQKEDPGGGDPYVEVTLRAGVAIDGTGREIVVPDPVVLLESGFEEINGADPKNPAATDPYPVFLAGLDDEQVPLSFTSDRCGTGQPPARIEETYQIIFGKLGDQLTAFDPVAVGDGPGDGDRWRVLLGYVHWNGEHFVDISDEDPQGVAPPRAGVRAAVVAAPAGGLVLRTRPVGEPGTVLRIDEKDGFFFGTVGAGGSEQDLVTVSPAGTLTVRGSITEAPRGGDVLVASGVINDGLLLPLPAGVDPDKVAEGSVVLHVWLRPHRPEIAPPLDEISIETTVVCHLDEERRVNCRIRTVTFPTGGPVQTESPAPADFLLLAVAATEQGG